MVCDIPADAFNRLYTHFCRYPSFRDVLLRSDPVMYERLARITLPAKPTRKKKPADAFNRLYTHFCRYPSFRDVLLRSDPVMYERLARITLPAKPTRKKKK